MKPTAQRVSLILLPTATRTKAKIGIVKLTKIGSPRFAKLFRPSARGESISTAQIVYGTKRVSDCHHENPARLCQIAKITADDPPPMMACISQI